ncbi:helix-turn-helix domain-containing protein [Leuconostoc gasicomitatum]|uniref:helix-turn-helix domain-containing protein n=1 Tax=Leuconostoc gasicomitatum TaxID=115778 RepID=UPI001CC82EB3
MQANLAVGHRITTILKVLQISRSTYYQWLSRQPRLNRWCQTRLALNESHSSPIHHATAF